MFKNFSFRQKLLLSYFFVFIVFLAFFFPFASHSVRTIVRKTFKQRTLDLITKVSEANNLAKLIEDLKKEQQRLFFRVTLLNDKAEILYDSHKTDTSNRPQTQPEILEALSGSTGYNEQYSALMGQKLIYVARPFLFHEQLLVLRTAFPFKQFDELIAEFEIGFLTIGSITLLLFAILMWMIIQHLTKPIQQIIEAVKPYQAGLSDIIPKIAIKSRMMPTDEFGKLAVTLNSLSERIQGHINLITLERNNQEIILESLGEGIVAVDQNMRVTYANKVALDFLQMKKDDLVQHSFLAANQPQCKELLAECLKQNKMRTSSLHLKAQKLFLELVTVPMSKQKGAVLVLQDKTSHFRVLEMGKDFIANASHELKTPITIVRGFAETLYDHPDLPREVSLEIISKILRNCRRMETLVRNLLTLADMESLSRQRLQECNLLDLIESCKQMLLNVYSTANISLHVKPDAPIHIIADPDLLELAIMNLLTNAAKYSNPPAQIDIFINGVDDKVELSIQDHGMGIPGEDVEHIFDRFYTVDKAHSRKLGGSGLGLSITKTIVEKHHGKIFVKSLLGKGSTFTIQLPIQLEDIHSL